MWRMSKGRLCSFQGILGQRTGAGRRYSEGWGHGQSAAPGTGGGPWGESVQADLHRHVRIDPGRCDFPPRGRQCGGLAEVEGSGLGLVTERIPGGPQDGSGTGCRSPDTQDGRGGDSGRLHAGGAWVSAGVTEILRQSRHGEFLHSLFVSGRFRWKTVNCPMAKRQWASGRLRFEHFDSVWNYNPALLVTRPEVDLRL